MTKQIFNGMKFRMHFGKERNRLKPLVEERGGTFTKESGSKVIILVDKESNHKQTNGVSSDFITTSIEHNNQLDIAPFRIVDGKRASKKAVSNLISRRDYDLQERQNLVEEVVNMCCDSKYEKWMEFLHSERQIRFRNKGFKELSARMPGRGMESLKNHYRRSDPDYASVCYAAFVKYSKKLPNQRAGAVQKFLKVIGEREEQSDAVEDADSDDDVDDNGETAGADDAGDGFDETSSSEEQLPSEDVMLATQMPNLDQSPEPKTRAGKRQLRSRAQPRKKVSLPPAQEEEGENDDADGDEDEDSNDDAVANTQMEVDDDDDDSDDDAGAQTQMEATHGKGSRLRKRLGTPDMPSKSRSQATKVARRSRVVPVDEEDEDEDEDEEEDEDEDENENGMMQKDSNDDESDDGEKEEDVARTRRTQPARATKGRASQYADDRQDEAVGKVNGNDDDDEGTEEDAEADSGGDEDDAEVEGEGDGDEETQLPPSGQVQIESQSNGMFDAKFDQIVHYIDAMRDNFGVLPKDAFHILYQLTGNVNAAMYYAEHGHPPQGMRCWTETDDRLIETCETEDDMAHLEPIERSFPEAFQARTVWLSRS